jgi:hypothetical protein
MANHSPQSLPSSRATMSICIGWFRSKLTCQITQEVSTGGGLISLIARPVASGDGTGNNRYLDFIDAAHRARPKMDGRVASPPEVEESGGARVYNSDIPTLPCHEKLPARQIRSSNPMSNPVRLDDLRTYVVAWSSTGKTTRIVRRRRFAPARVCGPTSALFSLRALDFMSSRHFSALWPQFSRLERRPESPRGDRQRQRQGVKA